MGIEALIRGDMVVRPLQELHAALRHAAGRGTNAAAGRGDSAAAGREAGG
jgi:hypothetical protein